MPPPVTNGGLTPFYQLVRIAGSDLVDIAADFDYNWDVLDTTLNSMQLQISALGGHGGGATLLAGNVDNLLTADTTFSNLTNPVNFGWRRGTTALGTGIPIGSLEFMAKNGVSTYNTVSSITGVTSQAQSPSAGAGGISIHATPLNQNLPVEAWRADASDKGTYVQTRDKTVVHDPDLRKDGRSVVYTTQQGSPVITAFAGGGTTFYQSDVGMTFISHVGFSPTNSFPGQYVQVSSVSDDGTQATLTRSAILTSSFETGQIGFWDKINDRYKFRTPSIFMAHRFHVGRFATSSLNSSVSGTLTQISIPFSEDAGKAFGPPGTTGHGGLYAGDINGIVNIALAWEYDYTVAVNSAAKNIQLNVTFTNGGSPNNFYQKNGGQIFGKGSNPPGDSDSISSGMNWGFYDDEMNSPFRLALDHYYDDSSEVQAPSFISGPAGIFQIDGNITIGPDYDPVGSDCVDGPAMNWDTLISNKSGSDAHPGGFIRGWCSTEEVLAQNGTLGIDNFVWHCPNFFLNSQSNGSLFLANFYTEQDIVIAGRNTGGFFGSGKQTEIGRYWGTQRTPCGIGGKKVTVTMKANSSTIIAVPNGGTFDANDVGTAVVCNNGWPIPQGTRITQVTSFTHANVSTTLPVTISDGVEVTIGTAVDSQWGFTWGDQAIRNIYLGMTANSNIVTAYTDSTFQTADNFAFSVDDVGAQILTGQGGIGHHFITALVPDGDFAATLRGCSSTVSINRNAIYSENKQTPIACDWFLPPMRSRRNVGAALAGSLVLYGTGNQNISNAGAITIANDPGDFITAPGHMIIDFANPTIPSLISWTGTHSFRQQALTGFGGQSAQYNASGIIENSADSPSGISLGSHVPIQIWTTYRANTKTGIFGNSFTLWDSPIFDSTNGGTLFWGHSGLLTGGRVKSGATLQRRTGLHVNDIVVETGGVFNGPHIGIEIDQLSSSSGLSIGFQNAASTSYPGRQQNISNANTIIQPNASYVVLTTPDTNTYSVTIATPSGLNGGLIRIINSGPGKISFQNGSSVWLGATNSLLLNQTQMATFFYPGVNPIANLGFTAGLWYIDGADLSGSGLVGNNQQWNQQPLIGLRAALSKYQRYPAKIAIVADSEGELGGFANEFISEIQARYPGGAPTTQAGYLSTDAFSFEASPPWNTGRGVDFRYATLTNGVSITDTGTMDRVRIHYLPTAGTNSFNVLIQDINGNTIQSVTGWRTDPGQVNNTITGTMTTNTAGNGAPVPYTGNGISGPSYQIVSSGQFADTMIDCMIHHPMINNATNTARIVQFVNTNIVVIDQPVRTGSGTGTVTLPFWTSAAFPSGLTNVTITVTGNAGTTNIDAFYRYASNYRWGVQVHLISHSGARTSDFLALSNGPSTNVVTTSCNDLQNYLKDIGFDAVIFETAINDTNTTNYQTNMPLLISATQATLPAASMIIFLPQPVGGHSWMSGLPAIADTIVQTQGGSGVALVDMNTIVPDLSSQSGAADEPYKINLTDDIHYDITGAKIASELMLDTIDGPPRTEGTYQAFTTNYDTGAIVAPFYSPIQGAVGHGVWSNGNAPLPNIYVGYLRGQLSAAGVYASNQANDSTAVVDTVFVRTSPGVWSTSLLGFRGGYIDSNFINALDLGKKEQTNTNININAGTSGRVPLKSFGKTNTLELLYANGTATAPTAVTTGPIGRYAFSGNDGTTPNYLTAYVQANADETWSNSPLKGGSHLEFWVTPTGGQTITKAMIVNDSSVQLAGDLSINNDGVVRKINAGQKNGLQIGSATAKMGFWGASPVVQYVPQSFTDTFVSGAGSAFTSLSTSRGGNDLSANVYKFSDVVRAMKKAGILA